MSDDGTADRAAVELPAGLMDLTQVDDAGLLYISPVIHDWKVVADRGIDTVIDLEGGLDVGVPTEPHEILYVYYPILDEALPDPVRTDAVAALGALLAGHGHRVLSHCGMGFNRSALIAGLILHKLGTPGRQVVEQIRARRPGALYNDRFAEYLESLD